MGVYDDANMQRYVQRVGQSLAKNHIGRICPGHSRSSMIRRQCVCAARRIHLCHARDSSVYAQRSRTGGVLGHEVGHVDAKHGVDRYSRQLLTEGALVGASIALPKWQPVFGGLGLASQFVFLKYGRDAEWSRIAWASRYASTAGWSPQAMQGVLATLGRLDDADGSRRGVPNWALSHPPAGRARGQGG